MKKVPVDAWIGIFFVILAVFIQFVIIPNYISVPGNIPLDSLSPRFWPRIICVMMMVLGVVQIIVTFLEVRAGTGKFLRSLELPGEELVKIMGVIVLLIGYYAAVTYIGFMFSTMLFTPILALAYGERRILVLALICLIPGPALYLFFSKVAYTIFEPGKLFL